MKKKIIACILTMIGLPLLAADSTIGNLTPITTVPDTYVMPWEFPTIADFKITFNNLTNQILAGYSSQGWATAAAVNAAQAATNGFPWSVLYDAAGAGTTAAHNATNNFPWGVLYDAAGAGTTAAHDATNTFSWSALYVLKPAVGTAATWMLGLDGSGNTVTNAPTTSGVTLAQLQGATNTANLSANGVALYSGTVSNAGNAATATSATNDDMSQKISTTYAPLTGTNTFTGINTFNTHVFVRGYQSVGTNIPISTLAIVQAGGAGRTNGISLLGSSYGGGNGGSGFVFGLNYNTANNKQMLYGDPDYFGNANGSFTRYVAASGRASIDMLKGDFNTRAPLQLGHALADATGYTIIGYDSTVIDPASQLWVNGNQTIGHDWKALTAPVNGLLVESNIVSGGTVTATNGVVSNSRRLLAPVSISVTASPFNWTNSAAGGTGGTNNIFLFIDGSGVTGSVGLNGTTIFSGVTGADATVPLQPGEYVTVTYSVGTPVMTWKPF